MIIHEEITDAQKTEHGIPVRNFWHMLLYVWNATEHIGAWQSEVEASPNLDALLASILRKLIRQRLRIGLGRGYRNEVASIAGIRGRVDFSTSLKTMSFPNRRAVCKFEVFDTNVLKNQIVRSTLHRCAQLGNFGSHVGRARKLRAEIRSVVQDLSAVSLIVVSRDMIARQHLGRNDADYSLMMKICDLIQRRLLPTESSGAEKFTQLDRNNMTLWDIFEKFIARFYDSRLPCWVASPQSRIRWPADQHSNLLPTMQPDLYLKHREDGRIVVLDTKFTAKSLVAGQRGKITFNRDHLFQIYAYLKSQTHISVQHKNARGVLLYPAVGKHLREQVSMQGHDIFWATVDLAQPWDEIEQELVQMNFLKSASKS